MINRNGGPGRADTGCQFDSGTLRQTSYGTCSCIPFCDRPGDKAEDICHCECHVTEPTFKDPEQVFDEAVAAGRLSDTPGTDNYAGRYMYMGTWDGIDMFKHINTRQYLPDEC